MQSIRRYFQCKFRLIQLEKSQKVGVIIPSSILPLACYSCALLPSIALIRHRILPHAILMLPATCCLPHATACCCLLPATLLIRLVGRPRLLLPTFSYLPTPSPSPGHIIHLVVKYKCICIQIDCSQNCRSGKIANLQWRLASKSGRGSGLLPPAASTVC